MYAKNTDNNFYDFRKPVKYAMIKFAIVIENGRSLKLRPTRQVVAFVLPHTQSTANSRPSGHYLTHMGLRDGIGAMGEGWERSKEEIER